MVAYDTIRNKGLLSYCEPALMNTFYLSHSNIDFIVFPRIVSAGTITIQPVKLNYSANTKRGLLLMHNTANLYQEIIIYYPTHHNVWWR